MRLLEILLHPDEPVEVSTCGSVTRLGDSLMLIFFQNGKIVHAEKFSRYKKSFLVQKISTCEKFRHVKNFHI